MDSGSSGKGLGVMAEFSVKLNVSNEITSMELSKP